MSQLIITFREKYNNSNYIIKLGDIKLILYYVELIYIVEYIIL